MDVELYIYDLSQGLARTASLAFLGTQIDAIYHTSIVFGGIEYTYDGGIKTVQPGKTHLGPPIQTLDLGATMLPMDVIMEYMDSLKEIYTQAAYDIWKHNCNNFSNDLATFLVGKGIPDYILKLPDTVLSTDFGQSIQPLINTHVMDQKRKAGGGLLGIDRTNSAKKPLSNEERAASVMMPTTLRELDDLLAKSKDSCTVIFFTSPTCKPCKTLYPHYVDLAVEHKHDCAFIVVNTINAFEIANKYSISATPTFMTFLHGEEENRWSGADLNTLKNNTNSLINMAWPPHPHESLKLRTLRESNIEPVLYGKLPPMEKLKIKMGKWAEEPSVVGVMAFVSSRKDEGAAESTLPDLDSFSWFLRAAPSKLPPEILFTIVDLLRLGLMDPRFSGYFAQEKDHKTIAPLLAHINGLRDCPYALRLVALQTGCNLFSSSLYPDHILKCQVLTEPIVQLIATSLLDDTHNNTRVAAASLAFNMAVANGRARREQHKEVLPEDQQTELAACLLEAIMVEEESPEALKGYLLAFAHLVLCCPKGGEMVDLLKSMGAQDTILEKKKQFPDEPLVQEIGRELLVKGF